MFTLKDFLSLQYIDGARVLSGCDMLSSQPVWHISVLELPETGGFIQKNELVLSTAVGCYENESVFLRFVEELCACRAAALVLTRKDDDCYLPESVSAYAGEHGFPILMIPWRCRFSEIIELVMEKIKNMDSVKHTEYGEMQKKLLSLYVSEEPLDKAAQCLSKALHAQVAITDKLHHIKGQSTPMSDFPGKIASADTVLPIQMDNRLFGYIFLFSAQNKNLILENRSYIEKYSVMPLTLWFNKEDIVELTTLRLKNDFLLELITNASYPYERAIKEGKRLGFDLGRPYMCAACRLLSHDKTLDPSYPEENFFHIPSIENLLIKALKKYPFQIMVTTKQDVFFFFIENTSSHWEKRMNPFLDEVEAILEDALPAYHIYWGISELKTEPVSIYSIAKNAQFALDHCLRSSGTATRLSYKDTKLLKMVSCLSDNGEIKLMALETLDRLKGEPLYQELIQTLIVFFQNNYNISKTARILHLHRQSLIYRLEKVENLLGISLSHHEDLFLLELYTRMFYQYKL